VICERQPFSSRRKREVVVRRWWKGSAPILHEARKRGQDSRRVRWAETRGEGLPRDEQLPFRQEEDVVIGVDELDVDARSLRVVRRVAVGGGGEAVRELVRRATSTGGEDSSDGFVDDLV
jgi:hypothetical protein